MKNNYIVVKNKGDFSARVKKYAESFDLPRFYWSIHVFLLTNQENMMFPRPASLSNTR
jgi:hypothetical protein